MVGRRPELAVLRQSLEEAAGGRRRLVLVSGDPGIGKSLLLDRFASAAADEGADVAWGRCWEAGGAPAYWPWTELLRATLRTRRGPRIDALCSGAVLSQLLPELDRGEGHVGRTPEDPDAARFSLFEAVAGVFAAASASQPLALLLDDLHAGDESSLLLLQFLATETAPAKLLLIAAYRDTELLAGRPLTTIARDLARLPATTRLPLTGLTQEEVATLTELTTSVAPSPLVASRLRDQTDGNPLYVREVTRLLAAEGRLGADGGLERLALPRDLRETVLRRLRRLPHDTMQALSAASVFGRDFRIDALGAVTGNDDILSALAEAEEANLVARVPDRPRYLRFSHAVVTEALYDELPLAMRLDLHRRAGETLEHLLARDLDDHLAELARHFCAAVPEGDADKAVDYSLRAADRAVRLLAYEEGVRLYTLALHAMEAAATGTPDLRLQALLSLGDTQARVGDSSAARETFLQAAALARRDGSGRDLARAALGYGGRFVWFRAGTDAALVPLLREALAAVPESERELRARLLARLAGALRDEPSLRERDDASAQAVALARATGDPAVLSYALTARFTAIWGPDSFDELASIAAEIDQVAGATQDAERLADARFVQFEVALLRGRIGEMRLRGRQSEESAEVLRQPAQDWYARMLQIVLLLLDGHLTAGGELIEAARKAGQRAQGWDVEASWLLDMPFVRWQQGRLPELEPDLARGILDYPGYPVLKTFVALLHAEAGRREWAAALAAELIDDPSALPRENGWLAGMTVLVEVLAMLDDGRYAERLYGALEPYADLVGSASGEAVTGSVHRPLGQLATLLGRYHDAERHFEQALAVHGRMGAPVWQCHTEYDYARMLLRRGGDDDAADAARMIDLCLARASAMGLTLLERRIAALRAGDEAMLSDATRNVFRREGGDWLIEFGGQQSRLRHSKGLQYLATLLARPHVDVLAIDLVTELGGDRLSGALVAGASREGDAGEILDERARAEYRRRLEALESDLAEAEEWGDGERAARSKAEIDFLASELAAAVGLGGRPRRAGSPAERARQSVRKAISSALDRIGAENAALAQHLNITIRTGYVCRYEPDPRVRAEWQT